MDVYATVNVQNIESLSDAVDAVTGAAVQEHIPDSVFDGADEVTFLDVEPAELIRRRGERRMTFPSCSLPLCAKWRCAAALTAWTG